MRVYAIRDRVAEEFGPPFLAKNDGIAVRQFRNFMSGPSAPPSFLETDFELYTLGEFVTGTGELKPDLVRVELPTLVTKDNG